MSLRAGVYVRVVRDNSTAVSVSVWRVVFDPEGCGSWACLIVRMARVHTACRV